MRTPHAQPDTNARQHRPPRSLRAIVIAFAAVEAAMLGWMLFSGRIH